MHERGRFYGDIDGLGREGLSVNGDGGGDLRGTGLDGLHETLVGDLDDVGVRRGPLDGGPPGVGELCLELLCTVEGEVLRIPTGDVGSLVVFDGDGRGDDGYADGVFDRIPVDGVRGGDGCCAILDRGDDPVTDRSDSYLV